MALNKEKVQDLIDDFVVNNVDQINDVASENPVLYDAVIDALNLLSRKFGTIQAINIPKPEAPKLEVPKANALNPIVQEDAIFIDIKDNETKVGLIDTDNELVYFKRLDNNSFVKLKFSVVNDAIEKGGIKLKEKPLNPLVKVGAQFEDRDNSGNPLVTILEIDNGAQEVKFMRENYPDQIGYTFKVVNDIIEDGFWVPVTKANTPTLNPKIKVGAWFSDTSKTPPEDKFYIEEIDNVKQKVVTTWPNYSRDYSFVLANDMIENGYWVAPDDLNPLVDIDEIFEDKLGGYLISITDIDYDKREVKYDKESLGTRYGSFDEINSLIQEKKWVHKPSSKVTQSNTFGALTLNPSVQVGQKYIDLDDDSNFSVLQIDQKKQVVTINWNEDDVEGQVDFEDFNDNLQAATWVLAPDQAQGPTTEADILEAIEGLELIGDAESKKEIAELKKQLKQLKKKKP
jgi:hypothetical protein